MRTLLLVLTLGLASTASAHDVDVEGLQSVAQGVEDALADLDVRHRTGGDLMAPEERLGAYQEAAAAFLLERHEEAALRFFVLRTLVDDPALRAEADWYLAQSLLEAGHDRLSEAVLREITGLDDEERSLHPFRSEAAALLLELTATHRPAGDFAPVHHALDARGLVASDATLAYSVGRSWYLVGQLGQAREVLEGIDGAHPVGPRASYLIATMDLLEGRRDSAEARFNAVAEGRRETVRDQHVADLAQLAVARLAYEAGRYDEAAQHYDRLDGSSPVLEDALYELAWTHIARGDDAAALRAVDLFLLAFPDAARAGRVSVARGHLQMRQGQWEEAQWTYEAIDARFETIEYELDGIQAQDVAEVLDGDRPSMLPEWVQERLVVHPDLQRAVASQAALERARVDLADADVLASELELDLARGDVALKRHRRLRSGLFAEMLQIAQATADVVRLQIDALTRGGRNGRARARALRPQLDAAQSRLDQLRQREAIQRGARASRPNVVAMGQEAWALVDASRPNDDHTGHNELDEVIRRLDRLHTDARAQLDALDAEADHALEPLQVELLSSHNDLARLHLSHVDTTARTATTREAAIASGIGEVEEILDDGIREARAGMGDAAFAALQERIEGREALQMERDELVDRLEQLFASARSRL